MILEFATHRQAKVSGLDQEAALVFMAGAAIQKPDSRDRTQPDIGGQDEDARSAAATDEEEPCRAKLLPKTLPRQILLTGESS